MAFYDVPLVIDLEVESDELDFDLEVENDILELDLDTDQTIVVNRITGDVYDGSYLVTPLAKDEVVLKTYGKVMRDDVTVKKVPYFETSNESGGYTVYIGEYDG